jgi:hypothetical protein
MAPPWRQTVDETRVIDRNDTSTLRSWFSLATLGVPTGRLAHQVGVTAASAALFVAVAGNEFVVAKFLSSDGVLGPSVVNTIRVLQGLLVVGALAVLTSRRSVLLTVFLGVSVFNLSTIPPRTVPTFEVDKRVIDTTLQGVRRAVMRQGHIGYIDDDMPTIFGSRLTVSSLTSELAFERYYLTQYAVAPVVVELGVNRPLVIANVRKPGQPQWMHELSVEREFPNGFLLLRHATK